MDPITGGLIAAGGSLLNGLFGSMNTQATNQMNLNMQNQQEAYNTQMSNTAYQRATADMKAAGLNPMMMFGSGAAASTPSAPSVSLQGSNPLQGAGNALTQGLTTAVQQKTANATVDNLVQENANLKTKQLLDQANTQVAGAQASKVAQDTKLSAAETDLKQKAIFGALNDAMKAHNEFEFRSTPQGKLLDQLGMGGRQVSNMLSPITNLTSSALDASRALRPYSAY